MAKIRKNYRLNKEVVNSMKVLIDFYAKEQSLNLNETTLIEWLVKREHNRVVEFIKTGEKIYSQNSSEGSE